MKERTITSAMAKIYYDIQRSFDKEDLRNTIQEMLEKGDIAGCPDDVDEFVEKVVDIYRNRLDWNTTIGDMRCFISENIIEEHWKSNHYSQAEKLRETCYAICSNCHMRDRDCKNCPIAQAGKIQNDYIKDYEKKRKEKEKEQARETSRKLLEQVGAISMELLEIDSSVFDQLSREEKEAMQKLEEFADCIRTIS